MLSRSFEEPAASSHATGKTWCLAAGPSLLVCGDLHLENFGAYRDDEGEFLFDINDFDESCLGPCAVDPVRCATSILLAAELWDLSPLHANRLVIAYLDEYRQALTLPVETKVIDAAAPRLSRGPIWEILGKTAIATQNELLDHHTERLKNGTRRIVGDKRKHPELGEAEARTVLEAVKAYALVSKQEEALNPLDVTGRIVGIGSLGVERHLILVAGGGSAETNRLLDIKEAKPSVWMPFAGTAPALPGASEAARVLAALLQSDRPPVSTSSRSTARSGPRDDPRGEPFEPRPLPTQAGQTLPGDRRGRSVSRPVSPGRAGRRRPRQDRGPDGLGPRPGPRFTAGRGLALR